MSDNPRDNHSSRVKDPGGVASSLPHGAKPIDVEDDYFVRQGEFRVWLRESKDKYVDQLTSEKSRSYFRKFVKAWNSGKLSDSLYSGINSTAFSSATNTAYRWSFAEKGTGRDRAAMEAARDSVGSATYEIGRQGSSRSSPPVRPRVAGPTLPSSSDWAMQSEERREAERLESKGSRKRERQEEKERVEDLVGPKETGREGMLEKKRLKREGDRQMREKDDGGLEVGEDVLMGGGDSFKVRLAQRDAARRRMEEKKQTVRMERGAETQDRMSAMREREKATMAHFQALAKEKFGG